jgi:hypothetical protein
MRADEIRVEVLAAAVRAIAQVLTPSQAGAATSAFLQLVEPLGHRHLTDSADQVAAAEVRSIVVALSK